jgi:hypothetical protein
VRPKGLVSFFRRPSTALLSLFFLLAVPCSAQKNPVKLDVNPVASRVVVGGKAGIRVTLLDSDNRPIEAPKDLAIQIQARLSPTDPPQKLMDVTMKAGQTSQTFTVPLRPELRGFVYLWARHEELLAGGAFLRVADSVPHIHAPKRPRPPEKAEPKGTLTPRGGGLPEPPPKPEARKLPSLALRFSPQRLDDLRLSRSSLQAATGPAAAELSGVSYQRSASGPERHGLSGSSGHTDWSTRLLRHAAVAFHKKDIRSCQPRSTSEIVMLLC